MGHWKRSPKSQVNINARFACSSSVFCFVCLCVKLITNYVSRERDGDMMSNRLACLIVE